MIRSVLLVVVALGLAVAAAPARADEPPAGAARPWAEGVSDEAQAEALALFRAGNDRFADGDYAAAAARYREALARWDHPAIHGNLAVCLIHLDDPVEAYTHLEKALAWGAAPFDGDLHEQLVTNRKLLLGQLGHIEVVSEIDGAVVTLDGRTLLAGKGKVTKVVRAGAHQIVARKPGHLTFTSQVTALPERPLAVRVVLVPLAEAGGSERHVAEWKPWAVVGGGLALAALGGAFQLAAAGNLDAWEEEIALSCPSGCRPDELPQAVRDLETRGRWQSRLGVGLMIGGAVTAGAGGWLLWWNRPRRVRLGESGERLGVGPAPVGSGWGVAARGSF